MLNRYQKASEAIGPSEGDFFLAQERWLKFWKKQGDDTPSFAEFLGLTRLINNTKVYDLDLGPDISPKIRMLCGPHWYALLKAYQLRNENDVG